MSLEQPVTMAIAEILQPDAPRGVSLSKYTIEQSQCYKMPVINIPETMLKSENNQGHWYDTLKFQFPT